MAVGTGIGFDISQLDAEIKKADEALKSLGKTGERTSKQINEAFSLAKSGNIQDFISVIERLSNTLSKKGYNQAAQMVREIATETAGAIDRVNRFSTLMQAINDGGRSNVKNGAIESLKYQIDEALARLGVLNEQLQFYTKGEGAKAVGANVVDTSALQDEANKLRVVVELLQRRLEHEQALAALKKRSDSIGRQQELDSSWQQMEKERTENLQRQSTLAKEANKAFEQSYNERYQMYAVMFDKMWQKDLENFERQNASAKSGGQKYATEYEERQRFYEQWINQNYLQEQERTQQEAQQANERARNSSAAYQQELREKERFYLDWINKTYEADERRRKKEEEEEKKKNERIAAEAKKAAEAQARLDSESRKRRYHAYTTSYEGAIRTSDKAKTLAQEIQAVKNLEAARAKLIKTDSDYQKKLDELNKRIRTHNENIKTATAGTKELESAHSKLGSKIATVFSAQAIVGYVNKMIKVRGEMELQQRALQAILQDKDKANEVWQKTVDLAVKSPFRINKLVSYTKQLAAYRIEADKLYDTNKMLADVSAGLGVDMQRLILAFGQVKSANFLRGTELRQFTEAGIPMLDELAKLYRDMGEEGVTAADVFDRISKRMVLFEDVEKVFERMTSASGTFYRMQEIQSETLKGQISNLKDSIDIMLNDMGKANDGILKFSVKTVKLLVDNYESLIPVLKALIAYLALYKISAFKASEATIIYAKSINMTKVSAAGLGGMWTSLRASLHKFGASMGNTLKMLSANPWILLATAVVASVTAFVKYRNELKKVNKEYAELRNRQAEITAKYYKTTDLDKQKEALKELIEYAEKEYSIEVEVDIKSMSREEVKRKMNELRQQLLEANAFGVTFQQELIRANAHTKWDDFGTRGIFEQGLFKDIDEMGNAYDELNTLLLDSLHPTIDMLANKWGNLSEEQKESLQMQLAALQSLKHGIGDWEDEDEDMVEYFDRLRKNFQLLVDSGDITDRKLKRALKAYRRDYDEAVAEFEVFAKRIDETVNAIESDEDKTIRLNAAIDDAKFEREWSVFEETVIRRLLSKRYSINLVPQIEEDDDSLKAWQESYKRKFAGKAGYREITDEGTSQAQVIERLQGTYQSLEEQIKRIKKAGKDSVLTGGAYEGEPIEQLERQLKEVKAQLDWFGASTKKGGGGSGKDVVMEKLKNRINLIKEMNTEYEKLRKTFSDVDAIEKVKTAYEATAKKLGLDASTMDFTDAGTIKSLEDLLGKPEYAANKYVLELQKALDNFKVELGIEVKEESDELLNDKVQALFDQYELSLDLKKLNLSPKMAKELFDVSYLDIEGLREELQNLAPQFIGTDQEKKYKEFLDKIDEMERKSIIERTKTYSEYLMRGMNERVKLKVKELNMLKELEESEEFTPEQKKQIRRQIKEDSQKQLDEAAWTEFTERDSYIMMFEDLEALGTQSIKNLYEQLDKLKSNLSHLDPSDVKEIVNQMERLQEEMIKRNPFKAFADAKKDIKAVGEDEETLISRLFSKEKIEAEAQAMIDSITTIENAFASGTFEQLRDEDKSLFESFMPQFAEGKDLEAIKKQYQDILEAARDGKALTAEQLKNFADYRKSLQGISDYWGEIDGKMQDIVGSAIDIMDAYGVDESIKAIAEGVGSMSTLITQAIQFGIQMKVAGIAANSALGIIGWIAIAIQAISTIISAIANYRNAKIDEQLEEQAKLIERQRDLYEQIEKKVESAYNVDNLREYNAEMKRSVELEIQALEASIALEKSRKNVDEEQVKDYENQIAEARERLTESTQGMMEELNGIFDLSDFTSGFIDAWWDAMDEGMNGLDALNEHFNETMKDMVKKQALYRGAQEIMSQVQDAINKSLEGDFTVDEAEWQAIMNAAKQANVNLDEFLQGWYDMFGAMSDSASGGLSALQKGIQGITEDTAQIIEAYLNSIRGYVSEQVTHTKNIYRILNDAVHSDAAAIRVRMV